MQLDHLKFGGAGGGVWAELKLDDSKFPPVDAMHKAILWTSQELYSKSVWSWLLDEETAPVTSASKLNTQEGSICHVVVKTELREEKLLIGAIGPEQGFLCCVNMCVGIYTCLPVYVFVVGLVSIWLYLFDLWASILAIHTCIFAGPILVQTGVKYTEQILVLYDYFTFKHFAKASEVPSCKLHGSIQNFSRDITK